MIRQRKVWIVECDKCGEIFHTGDHSYDVFNTKKEAIEIITDDWEDWQYKGGKVYCDECRTY